MILSKWKKYYEASEESIFQRDGWDSNFHVSYPRKLGEKTRGGRVSNVDFFFFFDESQWNVSRGDEAHWSKHSILKRNVSKLRTDLQRKSRWISVGFLVFHIPILLKILYTHTHTHTHTYIYILRFIDSFELSPLNESSTLNVRSI